MFLPWLQVSVRMNAVHYFLHFLVCGFVVHKGNGRDQPAQLFDIAAAVPAEQQMKFDGNAG